VSKELDRARASLESSGSLSRLDRSLDDLAAAVRGAERCAVIRELENHRWGPTVDLDTLDVVIDRIKEGLK
jgi:hypothetical protein